MTMMGMDPNISQKQQPKENSETIGSFASANRSKLIGCVCFSIFFLFGSICIGSGLFLYVRFDNLFGETVRGQMAIDDTDGGNWWFQQWRQTPGRETLTLHVFEVENSEELRSSWVELAATSGKNRTIGQGRGRQQTRVVSRVLPQVREVGPFVFRVERRKERIQFSGGDLKPRVGYVEHVRYHFDLLLSYEDLEHRITVINSELASLTPFIKTVAKRARSVKKISQSLRMAIDQMLEYFLQNLFVERPIWRIIFGPNHSSSNDIDDEPEKANLQFNDDESEEEEEEDSVPGSIVNDTFQFDFTTVTDDPSVAKIMAVYDRIRPYLRRLGVRINPYRLLHQEYRFETDSNRLVQNRKRRSSPSMVSAYRQNSIFALFSNNTRERFDAFTGTVGDDFEPGRHAQIFRWNHLSDVDAWYGSACNAINGTDGHQFEPLLKLSRVYEFVPRICRSLPLMLTKTDILSTPGGINLRRYTRAGEFMQSPFRNRKNLCYCRYVNEPKRCNYDGILDLSNCYHGSPILLTAPHFSGVITQSIRRSITGMTPDEEIYQTYADLEPISGAVLDKTQRFQFNVHLPPMPLRLNASRPLPERIIPLLWYQDQWVAPNEYQSHLKYYFVYPMQYQQYAMMALLAVGLLMLAIAFISAFYFCFMKKPNEPPLIQVIDPVISSAQQAKQKQFFRNENDYEKELAKHLRQQPQPILQPVRFAAASAAAAAAGTGNDGRPGIERSLSTDSQLSIETTRDPFAEKMNELFPDEYLNESVGEFEESPQDDSSSIKNNQRQRRSIPVRSPPLVQSTSLAGSADETNSLPDTEVPTPSFRSLIAGQMLLNRQKMQSPPPSHHRRSVTSINPSERTESPRKIFPLIRTSGRLPDEKELDYGFFRTQPVNSSKTTTERKTETIPEKDETDTNPMMDLGYGNEKSTEEKSNNRVWNDSNDEEPDEEEDEEEDDEAEYPEEQDDEYPLDFYQAVPWPVANNVLAEVKLRSRILNSKRNKENDNNENDQ